jgi:glycosyltransferase involved in cell wall biosynthesis
VGDTVEAFRAAGLNYYNEGILKTCVGTLPIRAGKQYSASRKFGKTHQNILVFVKGDGKKAAAACRQNKLLEAMAMKLPCVTSKMANNALGALPNHQIFVAETPEQYAQFIIELLQDEEKANNIGLNGYNFVVNKFNWKTTTALLEELFSSNK